MPKSKELLRHRGDIHRENLNFQTGVGTLELASLEEDQDEELTRRRGAFGTDLDHRLKRRERVAAPRERRVRRLGLLPQLVEASEQHLDV